MSIDIYNTDPWTLFTEKGFNVYYGKVFSFNPTESSGKSDGCEAGCWRTFGHVRTIRSQNGKLIGFKRLLKFIPKKKPLPLLPFVTPENWRYQDRTWVMQEQRSAKKWCKYKATCKIQLLLTGPCHDLLKNHIRGIDLIE